MHELLQPVLAVGTPDSQSELHRRTFCNWFGTSELMPCCVACAYMLIGIGLPGKVEYHQVIGHTECARCGVTGLAKVDYNLQALSGDIFTLHLQPRPAA